MPKKPLKTDTYRHQLRSTIYVFLVLALFIFSVEAMSAETASILPKGVSRLRVVGVQTGAITEKLNSNGRIEPMTASLNRSVTTADLAKGNKDLKALVDGVALLDQKNGTNYSSNLITSNLYSDFQLHASQVMPAYEFGLTENLNLGIRVPIVSRRLQASFRADSANNGAAVAQKTQNMNANLSQGLAQVAAMNFGSSFFSDQIFTSKGYEAPHDFSNTHVGDIEIGGKYRFRHTDRSTSSFQAGLRLPTGSRKSRTNIFDTGTGNGTWASGLYLFHDYYPTSKLIIGSAFKGIYNFADQFETAVPRDADDSLPSNRPQDGQVQRVNRVSGMEYNGELSSTLKLFNGAVNPWLAYQWAQHGRDSYSGPSNLYYEGLSTGTDYTRHAVEVGAGYTTVPAFVAKKAKIPYTIEGLYNRTFAGRNTSYVSYVRVDLISYF